MFRLRARLFAALALSVAAPLTPSFAQTSNFQPAPLFERSQITFRTLPNGVRAVVKQAPDADQVSVQVWVRAGSRQEQPIESGAAQLLGIMALQASEKFPDGARGEIEALGGDIGSVTARDATFFSATVAKPFWSRALGALADATLKPDLSGDAIDTARFEAYATQASRLTDSAAAVADLAYATSFARHPYRKPAQGIPTNLANLSVAHVSGFHRRHFVGGNISVVIVGDVAPAAAMDAVRRTFGSASNAAPPTVALPAEPAAKAQEIARRLPVAQGATALAWRSPGIKAPADVLALDVLLSLWREGVNANLRRALLRDGEDGPQRPLVEAYDVDFLTQRDPGLFMVQLVGYSDPAEPVRVVLDELQRVQNGVSAEELARAKEQLRRQYIAQSENVTGQAGSLGFYEMIDSYEFAVDYLARTQKVTAEDVSRVAKQYLSSNRLVRAEVQPLPQPKSDEEELAPGVIEVRWNGVGR